MEGTRGFGGLSASLFWGVLVAVAVGDPAPPSHLLAEILTCQQDSPSLSLSLTLDQQLLFSFSFPDSLWVPATPELPPWPPGLETPEEILPEAQICREILGEISPILAGRVPEVKATPVVSVFPALPPLPGEPNTLVCLVENIFPPALDITWTPSRGHLVTRGVTRGPYVPTAEGTLGRISTISVVPTAGDVHGCEVTSRRDNRTVLGYWVAPDVALDEELDTALAGAVLALGLVLALLGLSLALLARRATQG